MPAPKGHPPYPGCETGGRPKKYTQEFIENEADLLEEWMKKKENIFMEDFCLERRYDTDQLSIWAKENEKFSGTYKRFQMKQRSTLFKGGLSKKFAHPMCTLLLGHSHGIYAKTEQRISGDSMNPLLFAISTVNGSTKDLVEE
jgi:hypothetical protein